MSKLTVHSNGAGQDSKAILVKLIHDPVFRKKYAPNDLIVVTSDTGNEHQETAEEIEIMRQMCMDACIPFFFIDCHSKYFTGDWRGGYINFLRSGNRIGSKAFPKTCTDKLKIQPIYKFLEDYVHETYSTEQHGRKSALKEFAKTHGKIDVLIGIAKGEEKRVADPDTGPKWMQESINRVYPLIDEGLDRAGCHDVIESYGHNIPIPSNCILCPWMSEQELLYLYMVNPGWYYTWVELEKKKLEANRHKGAKNMGVWGVKTLPEKLEEAKKKFAHMTIDDLKEYKFSHGHCVKSKY